MIKNLLRAAAVLLALDALARLHELGEQQKVLVTLAQHPPGRTVTVFDPPVRPVDQPQRWMHASDQRKHDHPFERPCQNGCPAYFQAQREKIIAKGHDPICVPSLAYPMSDCSQHPHVPGGSRHSSATLADDVREGRHDQPHP